MTTTRPGLGSARRSVESTPSTSPSTDGSGSGRGFQPAARRRNRIALGVLLAAIAIGGNLLIYANLDAATPAVQVVRDVPAGARITTDMLRTVDVDADSTVNFVTGDRLDSVVGQYAKVRLVSGSLATAESFQATPLVAEGSAVVAIQVADGTLPIGLRERVPVLLVIAADGGPSASTEPVSIDGRVVGLPVETTSALGVESLSVEVARDDAATIAAADDVRVVLLEPSADPAAESIGSDGAEVGTDPRDAEGGES